MRGGERGHRRGEGRGERGEWGKKKEDGKRLLPAISNRVSLRVAKSTDSCCAPYSETRLHL